MEEVVQIYSTVLRSLEEQTTNIGEICMEAYLQGQDLWELVVSADAEMPVDTPENA